MHFDHGVILPLAILLYPKLLVIYTLNTSLEILLNSSKNISMLVKLNLKITHGSQPIIDFTFFNFTLTNSEHFLKIFCNLIHILCF